LRDRSTIPGQITKVLRLLIFMPLLTPLLAVAEPVGEAWVQRYTNPSRAILSA
jgi:hypothetical protein